MKENTFGYRWKARDGMNPALLSATAVTARVERRLIRIQPAYWILDYEALNYGRYRVGKKNSDWHSRHSNTAHLYPPGTVLWEDTRLGVEKRDSVWIFFTDSSKSGLDALVAKQFGYARFLDSKGKLGELLHGIAEIGMRRGENGFWEAQALLCQALSLLTDAQSTGDETRTINEGFQEQGMFFLAERVDTFMKSHLGDKLTLPEIARHLHVSVSLLSHQYRRETGNSPAAAFARFRVEQAKSLLLKGFPLKTVAAQLGFADAFHLSKTFKRLEGISPRAFITGGGRGSRAYSRRESAK